MDDKRKKLIDRVVKLFRLGAADSGTTEAEMMLAVSKARQLMAEHAISMTDIESLKGHDAASAMDARIRDVPVYTRAGKSLADYDWHVASAVGALTDTEVFVRNQRGPNKKGGWSDLVSVVFVGDEDDVALAGELFHLWLTEVRKMARRKFGSGNTWGIIHTSYAVGVGHRLGVRAREMVHLSAQGQQVWGLVVSNKKDAIARWKAKFAGPVKERSKRKKEIDPMAYAMGYRDGAHVQMNTKVIGKREEVTMIKIKLKNKGAHHDIRNVNQLFVSSSKPNTMCYTIQGQGSYVGEIHMSEVDRFVAEGSDADA
jgi:hypothetical protein